MQPILRYYHRQLTLLCLLFQLLLSNVTDTSVWAQEVMLPQPESITSKQGLPQAFVPSIVQDQQGFIWLATREGLCRYDGNHFKVFQPATNGRPGISSSSLFGLTPDQKGRIWVFSDQNDIDIIDPLRETFVNISRQPLFKRSFGRDIIDAHYIDQQGHLWLSFLSDKVVRFDTAAHNFRQYKRRPIPGYFPTFSAFEQDKQGTIWMANNTGLYRFDSRAEQFVPYPLPANDVKSIHVQANGDLFVLTSQTVLLVNPQTNQIQAFPLPAQVNPKAGWHHSRITCDSQGNVYFNQYNLLFRFSREKSLTVLDKLDQNTAFRGLFVDKSDVLWAGTDRIGVLKYNLKTNMFRAMPYQRDFYHDLLIQHLGVPAHLLPNIPQGISLYNFRYNFDSTGKLWFNMGTNLLYQIDLQTRQLQSIPFPLSVPIHHSWTDPVVPMATDPSGRVWIVTDSLAMWYEGGHWNPFRYPIRSSKSSTSGQAQSMVNGIEGTILQLIVDKQALWIITSTQGLYRVDRANGQIRHFSHESNNPTSLSSDQLFCLFPDPLDGTILWIGTFGSGLCRFDKLTGKCRRFSTQDGLPNNVIYCAIPDQQGFLWVGTNQGLCRMNSQTFQTRTYTHEDGLLEDEFNRFHFLHLPNDRILLGGLGGISSFYPRQLHDDTYQPPTQITDIQINNQPLLPSPLTDSLPSQAISQLTLPYNQNFITISFAALQYNRLGKIRYRYQLVGLNPQWIETNQPIAQYTDLRWGHYTLKLNASNTSGIWSKYVRVLSVVIRPPWWATWWAILLYIAGLGVAGYVLVRSYLNQQEAKQLKAIDAIKARFFTNITHEFRTPLTLIIGSVETLKQRLPGSADQHQLDLINRNATQLLELVNQLMDLSKAEANALRINESQGDLVAFLTDLIHSFEPQANTKGIRLIFQAVAIRSYYWFDTDKLERIVSNLVTNALKFTPMGGKINVELTVIDTYEFPGLISNQSTPKSGVRLTVADNGIGIASEKLPLIFDRFYQVESSTTEGAVAGYSNHYEQKSTGIGLALVKELVEFQSGTIQVESKVSLGTTFTIELPYRPATAIPVTAVPTSIKPDVRRKVNEQNPGKSPVILVVEDNTDLREYITISLPSFYEVHQSTNGAVGWDQAVDLLPDLIISDVLMPVMDGYTLCHKLKTDPRTSHIPVILLTAKTSVDSRLEGLSLGADDYIAKPFHVQEFQLRVRNLLEQRRQLQQWVLASITSPDPLPDAPAPTDPLIEKLCQLVEQNLDETTFGAEELTLASGMSRMNLHRKLKALTDTSTGEFIRNYRLKRAAQLLRQGHTVSETAYLVGFEDPSYFARSFRKVYHMAPSAFSRID